MALVFCKVAINSPLLFFQEIFIIFIADNLTNRGWEKHIAASLSSSALGVRGVITHAVSSAFHT